jgi:hypothetical protein
MRDGRSLERFRMPRFVLLEHDWEGVHWDFMLESGETLRTWAIDAPIVPGHDLPARALGDHRRIYLEYEGEISGGRGRVRRLDSGTYRVVDWSAELVRVHVMGSQLAGKLELRYVGGESLGAPRWIFRMGNLD